jgi:tetratricopeptide (TPR) repeat protein
VSSLWRLGAAACALGLALGAPARADEDDAEPLRVMEKPLAPLPDLGDDPEVERRADGATHPDAVTRGARILRMDVEFVAGCYEAVQLVYRRRYADANKKFGEVGARFRGTATEPVGQLLVWQALMIENFDFRYDKQYRTAFERSRQQLAEAILTPGNDAWDQFLMASILGVDAIHAMRKSEYISALNRGIDAIQYINRCKQLAPDFVDAWLGDALYNYWRTIITQSTKGLPSFGDMRAKGIEQMRQVERDGIFLGPAATLSLTYTWIEEGDLPRALASAQRNRRTYPENVINNLVLGRIQTSMRAYADAERTYAEVERIAPDNQRVHYYRTLLFLRTRDFARAHQSVDRYLAFPLEPEFQAAAWYQKGVIYYREENWAAAEKALQTSLKAQKTDRAKVRLDATRKKAAKR